MAALAKEVAALAKEKEAKVTALAKDNMDKTAKLARTQQLLVATLWAAGVVNAHSFLGGSPKAGPTGASFGESCVYVQLCMRVCLCRSSPTMCFAAGAAAAEHVVKMWRMEQIGGQNKKRVDVFKDGLKERPKLVACLLRDVPSWAPAGMNEEKQGA